MRLFKGALLQVFFIVLLGQAANALEFPEELAKEFPPCKGSEVVQVTNMQGSLLVNQICQDTPENVAALYKSNAEKAGYTILMDTKMPEMIMIVTEKGNVTFSISVGVDNGKTMVALAKGKK